MRFLGWTTSFVLAHHLQAKYRKLFLLILYVKRSSIKFSCCYHWTLLVILWNCSSKDPFLSTTVSQTNTWNWSSYLFYNTGQSGCTVLRQEIYCNWCTDGSSILKFR